MKKIIMMSIFALSISAFAQTEPVPSTTAADPLLVEDSAGAIQKTDAKPVKLEKKKSAHKQNHKKMKSAKKAKHSKSAKKHKKNNN